jgi:hypothetical protein
MEDDNLTRRVEDRKDNRVLHVLLDSNAWISKHLLRNPTGASLLVTLKLLKGRIILPEVVELELLRHVPRRGEEEVSRAKGSLNVIRELLGRGPEVTFPKTEEFIEALKIRLTDLEQLGVLQRIAFSPEHARRALLKVVNATPPNAPENEQFRDSAIWEVIRDLLKTASVHFISNDRMFFEDRKTEKGLARSLKEELGDHAAYFSIHQDLAGFLTLVKRDAPIDKAQVLRSIEPEVRRYVAIRAEERGFELGAILSSSVSAFVTHDIGQLAIKFELNFSIAGSSNFSSHVDVTGECLLNVDSLAVFDVQFERISWFGIEGAIATEAFIRGVAHIIRAGDYRPLSFRGKEDLLSGAEPSISGKAPSK